MIERDDDDERVARLEARVATLEALLEKRSQELRTIQRHVCHRDLIVISRVLAGYPDLPFGPFDPDFWAETTDLSPAEVPETMTALWRSLRHEASPDPDDDSGDGYP